MPKWLPIVDDYLKAASQPKGRMNDHPIFAWCVVWLFDVGELGKGIQMAFKAIELGQPMAGAIKRKWPGFVADTVFDWAEQQAELGHSVEPYFSTVFNQVKSQWKLPEPVSSKFYKFAGLQLLRSATGEITPSHVGDVERLKEADRLLEKAAELYQHAQVKTVRAKIAMRLRAIEAGTG